MSGANARLCRSSQKIIEFPSLGDEWRKMRSTLSSSFTSSKMKMIFSLMTEAAKGFTDYFEHPEGTIVEVELKDTFTRSNLIYMSFTHKHLKAPFVLIL